MSRLVVGGTHCLPIELRLKSQDLKPVSFEPVLNNPCAHPR